MRTSDDHKWASAFGLALSLGLLTSLGYFNANQPASAAEFTMKMGVVSAEDAETNYLRLIKEAVEPDSKGRIEGQIFTRGQLGSQSASIQGLQLGTIEAFITPADFYSGIDPRMGVLSFPFLFKNRAHANRVLADPVLADKISSMLDAKGIVGCGQVATADVRYMLRSPLNKIADFNGKKMRINGTDAERERFRRLGVASVPMNLSDMITGLQNGTIDGSGSGITIWVNFNLETISKELLQVEDTIIISYCAMSKKWLDTMPADLRAMVIKNSRAQFEKGVKISDEFVASLTKKWEDRGAKTIRLSEAEQKEIYQKLSTVGEAVTQGKPELAAFYKEVKAVSDRIP
ncbi:MAG: TRAP transporter substrate-binding protein [Alphaproteobacteria bacterium]|nr:TRAP transporter substrate-binding protein [Alphaproteobacteria bacterium]